MLDDGRDSVRSAGLLLLVDLTSGANEDLRKIVAFEDVFGKIFALIQLEGGLAEAGITAQDCLSLLANLIKGSASNQTMFRESGCVAQLAKLLEQAFPPEEPEAAFLSQSREKSAFGLLQLLRLFLASGESSTSQNQIAFFRSGLAQLLIDLAFSTDLPIPIRTASLTCASDLIASNHPLQEAFAALTVVQPAEAASQVSSPPQTNGSRSQGPSTNASARASVETVRTYIIEALLSLSLDHSRADLLHRSAGCSLIQAYLTGHDRIRAHFLQRAISGHAQLEDAANVLTTLSEGNGDATGLMFASRIVQDLIADTPEAKAALLAVQEGNESEGEEVLSFLQTISAELEAALKQDTDVKAIAAHASLLAVFLWEFADAVDDVLAEGSSLVQTLAETIANTAADPLLAGLSAVLLGTMYEFSTKDSPIPRRTLTPLLTQKLGRSKYLSALAELRRQPAVRDHDMLAEEDVESLLSGTFVDRFQIEYSRLRKAIDKDPGVEVLPASSAAAGVDRDVLDDLRQQLQTSKEALAQLQESSLAASQKSEQEGLSAAKDLQTANAEVERLRRINQAMQQGHEAEVEKMEREYDAQEQTIRTEHQRSLDVAKEIAQRQLTTAIEETKAASAQKISDTEKRFVELQNAFQAEQSGHTSAKKELEGVTEAANGLYKDIATQKTRYAELHAKHGTLQNEQEKSKASSEQTNHDFMQARKEAEQGQAALEAFKGKVKELQEEVKGKDAELAAERDGFKEIEAELESAKDALAVAEKEAESAKSATAGAEGKAGDDTAKVEELKREVEKAKEDAKSAREELESMLLVMGDIEAKRDEYRGKVKELGVEVSDDDDEEVGEDEDEEEDEGEEGEEDDSVLD